MINEHDISEMRHATQDSVGPIEEVGAGVVVDPSKRSATNIESKEIVMNEVVIEEQKIVDAPPLTATAALIASERGTHEVVAEPSQTTLAA